jgi:hypothetical protein
LWVSVLLPCKSAFQLSPAFPHCTWYAVARALSFSSTAHPGTPGWTDAPKGFTFLQVRF